MSAEIRYKPVNLFFTSNSPESNEDPARCPIILIHGFFATNRTWNIVKYKIANKTKRKVYSVDMRNHGKSGYSNDFTLNHVAADIENFMKSQNISKAVFVAHSMNSRAIMALALTKPELVEKIVIEDMIVTDDPDTPKRAKQIFDFFRIVDKYIKAIPAHLPESEAHKMILPLIKKFFPENVENFSSANMTLSVPIYKDESGKFSWEINMEALFEFEKIKNDSTSICLKNPTFLGEALFLTGKRSYVQLRKDHKDVILKHFPNAEFYTFAEGFHNYHIEFSDLFIEVVSNFIEK